MQDLLSAGHIMQGKEMASRLLAGLPSEYDILVTVLELQEDIQLDFVITRLMEMETKMDKKQEGDAVACMMRGKYGKHQRNGHGTGNARYARVCWLCGKPGHIKIDCPQAEGKMTVAL